MLLVKKILGILMAVNDKPGIITRAEQKQHTRQKPIEATMAVIASEGFSGILPTMP
jgi:hypothetical protein